MTEISLIVTLNNQFTLPYLFMVNWYVKCDEDAHNGMVLYRVTQELKEHQKR